MKVFAVIRAFQPVTASDLIRIMGCRPTQVHSAIQNLFDEELIVASDAAEGKIYRVKLCSSLPLLQQMWTLALSQLQPFMESNDDEREHAAAS